MEVALIISTLLALGALIAWSRAKTPFESYFEARNTTDPDTQRKLLDRHASALMGHARELKRRDYSHWVEGSPDFVVMFIGADGILDAALDTRPALWEEAWQQHKVLMATPLNLIALDGMKSGMRYARNQTLVNIMRDYGYVDARGMGVRNKIIPGMRAHNNTEPDLIEEENRFTVRLWKELEDTLAYQSP